LAEALLKKLRPDLTVDSAGLHVAIPIPKQVKDYLSGRNAVNFLKTYPESIEDKKLATYDLVVAMEPRHRQAVLRHCPQCKDRIVVWNIQDPYFEEHNVTDRIFSEIEKRVNELAESI
jgi:protein-tyrosine-phosphatase